MKRNKRRFKRLTAIVLSLCIPIVSVTGFAAWDGYQSSGSGEGSGTVMIADMNLLTSITSATNLVPSTKITGDAMYTGRWNEHKSKGSMKINKVPRDWSNYETLRLKIYSAKATGAKVTVVIYSDYVPSPGTSSSYHNYAFTIDWDGWKTIDIPLGSINRYNNASYAKVNEILFSANGWGATPSAESDLYFDSIVAYEKGGDGTDAGSSLSGYDKTLQNAFCNAMGDGMALYTFSGNMFAGGKVVPLSSADSTVRTTVLGGTVMTPAAALATGLGAEISGDGNSRTLRLKNHTITVNADKTDCVIDGGAAQLPQAPFIEGETVYVPAEAVGAALGKKTGAFGDLTVLAGDETMQKLVSATHLTEVGSFMIANVPFDPDTVTHEDFVELKNKWRERLVGSEQINDLSNEYIAKKISDINNRGQSAWDAMNKDKDAKVLFGTTPVTASADMGAQFKHMYFMTLAYGTYGTELYHNKKLKQDILYALEWLRDNLYGPNEMEGHGWRDVFAYNWWDWYINVPMKLLPSLLILENEISGEMISRHTEMWEYVRTHMRQTKNLAEAQSRIQVVTMSAALQEDPDLMQECMEDFELILRPTTSGEGVYDDFTYLNHGVYPLVGMYGAACLGDRLITAASVLAGTKFEVNSMYKYNQALWIYNTFDPQMYHGNIMAWGNGRAPGAGAENGRMVVVAAVDLLGAFSDDDDQMLKEFIHRHVDDKNMKKVISQMSIAQIADLVHVMDEEIEVPERNYAHVYYHGDTVVWHRADYAVGIHMSSNRIGNYECINDVNKTGWYQGDGGVLFYNTADTTDPFAPNFWSQSNPYRVPGTTEDVQPRLASSYSSAYLSPPTFVGGAEMDHQYVTAAMDFEAFHNEKPPTAVNSGYGGDFDLHNNDLKAKKSWFMFDDEVVALGAGINSTTGFEVQTTVDNHAMSGMKEPETNAPAANIPIEYKVSDISAAGDDGNLPENVLDGDYGSRWSLESAGNAWLELTLDEVKPIGYVGIAMFGGTGGKQAIFKLELSEDGENWQQVFDGRASGTTEALEAYDCKGINAKYIRFVGAGRTNSAWNSITEFKVYAPQPDGQLRLGTDSGGGFIYGLEKVTVDGNVLKNTLDGIDQTFENASWAHLEGYAGYYFPQGGALTAYKENKSDPYLELFLSHGKNPKDAAYAYTLLPNRTAEETAAYAANPDITVLSNTAAIQAVREKNTNITGMVFWQPGTFHGFTASIPMVVMVKETAEGTQIAVSDPSMSHGSNMTDSLQAADCNNGMSIHDKTVTLTVNRPLTLVSADSGIKAETKADSTVLEINFGLSGKTLSAKLR